MLFSERPAETKTSSPFLIAAKPLLSICRYSIPIRNGWCEMDPGVGIDLAEALLEAQNRIPALTVRCNPLKINRGDLIRRLEEDSGIVGKPTPYSPQRSPFDQFQGKVDQTGPLETAFFRYRTKPRS